MSVRFLLRKSRLNKLGQGPIDCHVRVNGIPATILLNILMVVPEKWDSKAQRRKGGSDQVHALNKKLALMKITIEHIYDSNLARGRRLSAKEIVDTSTQT